jgi:Spy/CpxP family protein refolding chaperone
MKTKSLIVFTALFFVIALSSSAFAQQRVVQQKAAQQGPGLQIGLLYAEDMNLTDDQKIKIGTLMANHRATMRAERGAMNREARTVRRETRQERQADIQSEIQEILTAEQWATFQKNLEQANENRAQVHTYMVLAQADAISDEVELSASQKERVQALVQRHLEETATFRANRQARQMDVDDRIERLEAQRDFRNNLKEVMTEDQFEKWSAEWAKMHPGFNNEQGMRGQRGQRGERGDNRPRRNNR